MKVFSELSWADLCSTSLQVVLRANSHFLLVMQLISLEQFPTSSDSCNLDLVQRAPPLADFQIHFWKHFRWIINLIPLLRLLRSSQLDSASKGSHSPTLFMWVKLTTLGRKNLFNIILECHQSLHFEKFPKYRETGHLSTLSSRFTLRDPLGEALFPKRTLHPPSHLKTHQIGQLFF